MSKGYWHPPETGFFKLNIDGALFAEIHAIGFGAILRDHNVDVLLAASIKENDFQLLESIEFLAILIGLRPCLSLDIFKLLIESDYQLVV